MNNEMNPSHPLWPLGPICQNAFDSYKRECKMWRELPEILKSRELFDPPILIYRKWWHHFFKSKAIVVRKVHMPHPSCLAIDHMVASGKPDPLLLDRHMYQTLGDECWWTDSPENGWWYKEGYAEKYTA